jgi:PAS domain S-box-containing protein
MNPSDHKKSAELHLRAGAEKQIDNAPLTGGDPAQTDEKPLHELQVHQVELEMQNDALRQQQTELEAARDRYVDLYDFAPVGYLTLTSDGMIDEINLTCIKMLGMERKDLLHRPFTALVVAEDQSRWMQLILSVMKSGGKSSVEVGLQRRDGTVFQAQLDCAPQKVGAGGTALRVALTDISLRKRTEAALRQQVDELERFSRAAVDRELAMIELKRQVNALSNELGRAPPFALDFADAPAAKGLT